MVVYIIIMSMLISSFLMLMIFDAFIDVTEDNTFILHYTWRKERKYKILFKI